MARGAGGAGRFVRAGLAVAAGSLVLWTPPLLAYGGAPGFLNELFSTLGGPAGLAPVPPVFSPGVALYLRWGFQYLFLGGFALAAALFPRAVARPILGGLEGEPDSEVRSAGPAMSIPAGAPRTALEASIDRPEPRRMTGARTEP